MLDASKEAQKAIKLANADMKAQADKRRRPSRDYKEGDKVWLEATNLNIAGAPDTTKKLCDKRYGPFKVIKKIGASAYKLELPHGWKAINPTFNEALLSPYHPPEAAHQNRPTPPPPDLIDGEEEYEVETIL